VTAGQLSVFADVTIRGGTIDGYVKPLVRDVQVGAADAGPGRRIYDGMVQTAARVLENRSRGEVATVVRLSGPVDRPHVSRWKTAGRLLQNAFFRPITPGFEEKRPARPDFAADRPASSLRDSLEPAGQAP
jgi:hypothetical protein